MPKWTRIKIFMEKIKSPIINIIDIIITKIVLQNQKTESSTITAAC